MVATSGGQLLPEPAVKDLIEDLIPSTTVLTPNVPEAEILLASAGLPVVDIATIDDLISMAKAVQSLGSKYVLLKGGHVPFTKENVLAKSISESAKMMDVLVGEGQVMTMESLYQASRNTHGTGCSMACK